MKNIKKMDSTYDVIKYTNDDVKEIRKQINMDTEEKREEAFKIIEDWLLKQNHLVQNTFSRGYIERCILFSKGSLEKAKSQIDRMCTMRTLMPHYFEITDLNDKELKSSLDKFYVCCTPRMTKENYRVIIIKVKQVSDTKSSDILNLYKSFIIVLEFLKHYDYTMGYICICDSLDVNSGELIAKINLNDLQQVLSILIDGVGGRLKSIIFLTASKLMEGFVKTIKPLFKEKIRNRLNVATDTKYLKDYIISNDILPVEYGGTDKSLEQLNNNLNETLCSEPIKKLIREMHGACTDESKRQNYVFNENYMGMPGSFRTMSLD